MGSAPFLINFTTSGFGFLVTLLVILGVLQIAYFVVGGGLKGTRYYFNAKIHDPNPAVRAGVIRTLAARGDTVALGFLMRAVEDSEPNNRLTAIEGMRRFSEPAVQNCLIRLSGDPHPVVRRAAVVALGRFQSPEAIEMLVKRLSDTTPAVQIAAIQGLKVAQEPATIEAIARALTSNDKDVVRHAGEALIPFGIPVIDRLGVMLPEAGPAASAFIRVMTQMDRELASQAIAQALPAIRHTQAISDALSLLVRSQYPGMVTLLTQLLDVPDYPSHDQVIQSFVKLNDPEAIVPLCRQLTSARLRPAVVVALESLASVYGRELLVPLMGAIQSSDMSVRKASSHLLGRVGGVAMVDAGLSMLWGEDSADHRAFLERHLGYPVVRLATYPDAALSLDRLLTGTQGEEGARAIDELESLMILLYGDCMRGVTINEQSQLILKDRRTLYPMRFDHLHALASDLLDFASNAAEGDRFRSATKSTK